MRRRLSAQSIRVAALVAVFAAALAWAEWRSTAVDVLPIVEVAPCDCGVLGR